MSWFIVGLLIWLGLDIVILAIFWGANRVVRQRFPKFWRQHIMTEYVDSKRAY